MSDEIEPISAVTTDRNLRQSRRRHRLLLLIITWSLIASVFIVMTVYTRKMTHDSLVAHQEVTQSRLRSITLANQLMDASDSLSAQLWRFAATGEVSHGYTFLESLNEGHFPREDLDELYTPKGLFGDELYYLKQAKQISNDLMQKELWALRLLFEAEGVETLPPEVASVQLSPKEQAASAREKQRLARDYVFGDQYARRKTELKQSIRSFQESQRNMIRMEQMESDSKGERYMDLNMMMGILIISWLLILQIGMYLLLIRPVSHYSERLRKQSEEGNDYAPLDLQGSHEMKNLGLAFNHVLSQLQEAKLLLQRQNEELTVLSKTDHLTKVLNRLAMENYMEALLEEYRGTDWPIGIIMLDLDHFKSFNDAYGHPAGDDALRHVADILSGLVDQKGGLISRMGGEEFFILLPGQGEEAVGALADELLVAVRESKIVVGQSTKKNLTVSMGSYVYRGGNETLKMLYTYADKALYAAKKQGRDRHVTYASLQEKGKPEGM